MGKCDLQENKISYSDEDGESEEGESDEEDMEESEGKPGDKNNVQDTGKYSQFFYHWVSCHLSLLSKLL